jgi:hypothetical protein
MIPLAAELKIQLGWLRRVLVWYLGRVIGAEASLETKSH